MVILIGLSQNLQYFRMITNERKDNLKLIDKLLQLGVEGIPMRYITDNDESVINHEENMRRRYHNECHDQWENIEVPENKMDKYELMAYLHEIIPGYKYFDDGTKLMISEKICALHPTVKLINEEELKNDFHNIITNECLHWMIGKSIHKRAICTLIRDYIINNGSKNIIDAIRNHMIKNNENPT